MRSQLEVTDTVETDDGIEIQVDDEVWFTVTEAPDGKPMLEAHDLSVGGNEHMLVAADYFKENY